MSDIAAQTPRRRARTRPRAAPRPARLTGAERKARARTAMLEGPIVSTLVKLALPTIGVMVAQTAVGIAETYYVGFLGTDALAGVALVFPIFMLMTTMSNGGLGSGVASAIARAIGAGRQQDADALVFHSVVLAIIAGALFSGGILWGGPALYSAAGRPRRVAGGGAAVFQLPVRRIGRGVDREPARGRAARLGQRQGAGAGHTGRRGADDPGVAGADLRLRPDPAARHRRRRHRLRHLLSRRAAGHGALHALGPFRPDARRRAAAAPPVRRHPEGRPADGDQRGADQSLRHPRHRRGRPVRYRGAGRLRHRRARSTM